MLLISIIIEITANMGIIKSCCYDDSSATKENQILLMQSNSRLNNMISSSRGKPFDIVKEEVNEGKNIYYQQNNYYNIQPNSKTRNSDKRSKVTSFDLKIHKSYMEESYGGTVESKQNILRSYHQNSKSGGNNRVFKNDNYYSSINATPVNEVKLSGNISSCQVECLENTKASATNLSLDTKTRNKITSGDQQTTMLTNSFQRREFFKTVG